MSESGTLLDAVDVIAAAAISGLSTTRDGELSQHTDEVVLPRIAWQDPAMTSARLDWGQEDVEYSFSGTLTTLDETEEALILKCEALRDGLRADPTLAGAADFCWLQSWTTHSDPRADRRFADLVVSAQKVGV